MSSLFTDKNDNIPTSTDAVKDSEIHCMVPPRATQYSIQALFEQMQHGKIDLDLEYHRGVVWTIQQQTQYIDSILGNYYVPPIVSCVTVHDDGTKSTSCIDGKQRLTSIKLFMNGLIPSKNPHTGQQYWYKNNPETEKKDGDILLPEIYQLIFQNKLMVFIEYGELKLSDQKDIFHRLQCGTVSRV